MADNTFDPATTVIADLKGDYTLDPTHTVSASAPATRW